MKLAAQHSAAFAWVVLVVVLALVAWKFHDQQSEINQRTKENRVLIAAVTGNGVSIQQLRNESRDSCENYTALRSAVNRFHSTLIDLLRTAEKARLATYAKTHARLDLQAAHSYKRLLRSLHTVRRSCAQKH